MEQTTYRKERRRETEGGRRSEVGEKAVNRRSGSVWRSSVCDRATAFLRTMSLLDLPDELLVQIASYLAFHELVFLQQICSRWKEVVRSNATLQYAIELRVAGMIDNPASRLVLGERLRILQAKEKAWRALDMSDRRSLTLSHRPSGIYDLTGGTLLLGERHNGEGHAGTDAVHTMHLHAASSDDGARSNGPSWTNIDLGKPVIDVGLAIQEHDLIAIVTYS